MEKLLLAIFRLTLLAVVSAYSQALLASPVLAQSNAPKYDISLLPVSRTDYSAGMLRHDLNTGSTNPALMFQAVERASSHHQLPAAFRLLDVMRVKQPKNAVVQSGYCLAFNWLSGGYGPASYKYTLTVLDYQNYNNALRQSYRLDPKLWLTYAVEGRSHVSSPDIDTNKKGLSLLQKAVELAPNLSITHFLLGDAYTVYNTKFQSFDEAAKEFSKAEHLKPIMIDPALGLLDIYAIRTPNRDGALRAKADFLAAIPPNYKLSASTTGLIAYSDKKFGTP